MALRLEAEVKLLHEALTALTEGNIEKGASLLVEYRGMIPSTNI